METVLDTIILGLQALADLFVDTYKIIRRVMGEAQDRQQKALVDWLGRLVTLGAGALTILVSLQSSYMPKNPKGIWLLCVCWATLGLTVLAGLSALYGEVQGHRDFRKSLEKGLGESELFPWEMEPAQLAQIIHRTPYKYRLIFRVAVAGCAISFIVAVLCLAVFAMVTW